jgi:ADP-ribose pyrophosphatase
MHYYYQNPKLLFHGKRVDLLSIETPHPTKGSIQREVVDHPGAVVILPLLDSERLILIRNERPVVQQTLWELPAGTLEKGEEPQECAIRELLEETGYRARSCHYLFSFFSTPGFCNEKLFAYLAKDLLLEERHLDETENIEVFPLPLKEAFSMIHKGLICDAKTIATLCFFALRTQKNFFASS